MGCDRTEEFRQHQKQWLHSQAAHSDDFSLNRRREEDLAPDFRTPFHRDYTRILNSRAFRRLRHKTQVFIAPKNDHVCSRIEHTLHVASIAQTMARALKLNEDLVCAIAVGHDLGHAPFGHEGERALTEAWQEHAGTGTPPEFHHELHSLRVVDHLESPYSRFRGLNLTAAVRDGIVSHYGEGFEPELRPDKEKDLRNLEATNRGVSRPATLEGCVVRWADKIAYLGRDFEDAVSMGIVRTEDMPSEVREVLGTENRDVVGRVIADLVEQGIVEGALKCSGKVHAALLAFYRFNMAYIYMSPKTTRSFRQVRKGMGVLFTEVLKALEEAQKNGSAGNLKKSQVFCLRHLASFLEKDLGNWVEADPARLTVDYIAGMTDPFFMESVKMLFVPMPMDYQADD